MANKLLLILVRLRLFACLKSLNVREKYIEPITIAVAINSRILKSLKYMFMVYKNEVYAAVKAAIGSEMRLFFTE
jgi:hypothetical protein